MAPKDAEAVEEKRLADAAKPLEKVEAPPSCPRCHQPLAVGGLCPDRKCRGGVTS